MTPRGDVAIIDNSFDHRTLMCAYVCNYCKQINVAWLGTERRNVPDSMREIQEYMHSLDSQLSWIPKNIVHKSYDDVPSHIAEAASEAHQCLSFGALRGAVQLARSVVEATAKEKGITSGTLASKINAMHSGELIRPHVRDAAHEIRYLGNEMAHGDFVVDVSAEAAEEVVGLMDEILLEVFQSPARVEKRRQARLAGGNSAE